ncbi:DoxX family protein [Kribbella sp. CA-294648]|uniref:DoxX family protein n=1 Tax=Kribbella sp. CA-294648 TaxID=3239948 RepID=UPI003D8CF0C6
MLSTVLALGVGARAFGALINVRLSVDAMAKVRVGKWLATVIALLESAAVWDWSPASFLRLLGGAAGFGLVALMTGAALCRIAATDSLDFSRSSFSARSRPPCWPSEPPDNFTQRRRYTSSDRRVVFPPLFPPSEGLFDA